MPNMVRRELILALPFIRAVASKASAVKKTNNDSVSTSVAITICTGLIAAARPAGIANRRSSEPASAAMTTQVPASSPHWLSTGHSGDARGPIQWPELALQVDPGVEVPQLAPVATVEPVGIEHLDRFQGAQAGAKGLVERSRRIRQRGQHAEARHDHASRRAAHGAGFLMISEALLPPNA